MAKFNKIATRYRDSNYQLLDIPRYSTKNEAVKGDTPFGISIHMPQIKSELGKSYRFSGYQAEISEHLAKDLAEMVSKISYPYTPVKNYTEMKKSQPHNADAINRHVHLYASVKPAKLKNGNSPILQYGLAYFAKSLFGDFRYGAYQYNHEFPNRDTSIHEQSQGHWLAPLAQKGNPYHDKFVSRNRQYLEKKYAELVEQGLKQARKSYAYKD